MDIKTIVKETLQHITEGVRDSGVSTGSATTVHFAFHTEPEIRFSINLVLPTAKAELNE